MHLPRPPAFLGVHWPVAAVIMCGLLFWQTSCRSQDSAGDLGQIGIGQASSQGGSWRAIPVPPVAGRLVSVVAWTGTEAVFWSGTNLSRNHVFVDAYAYDVAAETWRDVPTPGWGHPGLTGVHLDGHLYLLAKGRIYEQNLGQRSGRFLPKVEGIRPVSIVAGDGHIWIVDPANDPVSLQPGLGIAQFDLGDREWRYGAIYAMDGLNSSTEDMTGEQRFRARWSPMGILVWDNISYEGLIYDPDSDTWSLVADARDRRNPPLEQQVILTEMGFAFVSKSDGKSSSTTISLLTSEGWNSIGIELPAEYRADLFGATFIEAGSHIVAVSDVLPPVNIRLSDGSWTLHENEKMPHAEIVNGVWTGDSLILWASENPTDLRQYTSTSVGAIWTP